MRQAVHRAYLWTAMTEVNSRGDPGTCTANKASFREIILLTVPHKYISCTLSSTGLHHESESCFIIPPESPLWLYHFRVLCRLRFSSGSYANLMHGSQLWMCDGYTKITANNCVEIYFSMNLWFCILLDMQAKSDSCMDSKSRLNSGWNRSFKINQQKRYHSFSHILTVLLGSCTEHHNRLRRINFLVHQNTESKFNVNIDRGVSTSGAVTKWFQRNTGIPFIWQLAQNTNKIVSL